MWPLGEAILSLAAGASPVAALGLLSRSQRRRLAALHCHTRLAPARAEDGAGALSEQLGEEGERLLEEMVSGRSCNAGGVMRGREVEV